MDEVLKELEIKNLTLDFLQKHIAEFLKVVGEESVFYWTEDNFFLELPSKWEYSYYAAAGNQIIGYAICSKQKNGYIHLHHLMISEHFQSKGIGFRLLTTLIKDLFKKNQKGLSLRVQPDNRKAIKFYTKIGFKKVREEDDGDILMTFE